MRPPQMSKAKPSVYGLCTPVPLVTVAAETTNPSDSTFPQTAIPAGRRGRSLLSSTGTLSAAWFSFLDNTHRDPGHPAHDFGLRRIVKPTHILA